MSKRRFVSFRAVWAIPVLAILSLALATWAWVSHHLDFDNALYEAVGLFNNANDQYLSDAVLGDWRFRVARWGGIVVLFSTVLVAIGALLHQRLSATLARYAKQAVVVIGDDALATAAFEAAQAAGKSVLWLGAPTFDANGLGAIALPWLPQGRTQTVTAHVGHADHIVVAHHDDAEALSLTRAARQANVSGYVTVLMRDVHLAEDAGATLNEAQTRVLSQAAIAARALAIAHPPFLIAQELRHERIHALIIGFGQTGQAIARDIIMNGRTAYLELPRITVIDPQAKALEGVLRVRAPEFDACAESLFITGEISGRAIHPEPAKIAAAVASAGPLTAAYVCLANDSDALSTAAMLQSLLRSIDLTSPPIFVRVREVNTIAPTGERREGLDALVPFGELASILGAGEFLSNAPDAAARAFCEAHRATLPAAQRDDPSNHSAFPWDRLDETYQQANRYAVAHIPAKLASAGVDPARWRGVAHLPRLAPGELLFADPRQLEMLAELEHERWLAQRRMVGWRLSANRDNAKRLHPSLIAYGGLTEELKELDRVVVRTSQLVCSGPRFEPARPA